MHILPETGSRMNDCKLTHRSHDLYDLVHVTTALSAGLGNGECTCITTNCCKVSRVPSAASHEKLDPRSRCTETKFASPDLSSLAS
jgi:hypothetical protein